MYTLVDPETSPDTTIVFPSLEMSALWAYTVVGAESIVSLKGSSTRVFELYTLNVPVT